MERIGRPGDDFREKLFRSDIGRICKRHGLAEPGEFTSEERGNEKVIYHLGGQLLLAFCLSNDILTNVETLAVLEQIEAMPTPRVIAWLEDDSDLRVPYMIVEKCCGTRLDLLWEKSGHEERLQLLEALGNLAPFVRDKFVPKLEYDFAVMQHGLSEQLAYLRGMVEERTGIKLPPLLFR